MIVLDSSFLIAYHNTRDVHHAAAARTMVHLAAGKWGQALLLEYVFLEVVTVLHARRELDVATETGALLLDAAEVDFVPCSDLFTATLKTFREQGTARLSFTDAAIVTTARRHRPGYVATFDTDFQKIANVVVIPTSQP